MLVFFLRRSGDSLVLGVPDYSCIFNCRLLVQRVNRRTLARRHLATYGVVFVAFAFSLAGRTSRLPRPHSPQVWGDATVVAGLRDRDRQALCPFCICCCTGALVESKAGAHFVLTSPLLVQFSALQDCCRVDGRVC